MIKTFRNSQLQGKIGNGTDYSQCHVKSSLRDRHIHQQSQEEGVIVSQEKSRNNKGAGKYLKPCLGNVK